MSYETVPAGADANDLLGLKLDALRRFASTVPGEESVLNDEQLLARAVLAGGLGCRWNLWLYEAHPGWRNNEAVRAATENADTMAALQNALLARDTEHGSQQHFPLPQFFLNIAGHSWSVYDHFASPGVPALHDDGQSYGIHALSKSWEAFLPPEKRSWRTDQFLETSAQLVDNSYGKLEADGTISIRRSEWVQRARRQLVTAVFLADKRQQFGWGCFLRGLAAADQSGAVAAHITQDDTALPTHIFTPQDFPELIGMDVRLITLPLGKEAYRATGKKTLQIYVIQPQITSQAETTQ